MENKTFTVTTDHLRLLPHLWFEYNDYTEFGAPEVDPKRPYGNSDVYGDIAEHLGIEGEEDNWGDVEYTAEQRQYMLRVHREMTTVLNIMVRNGGVALGDYVADAYNQNWKRA